MVRHPCKINYIGVSHSSADSRDDGVPRETETMVERHAKKI